MVLNQHIYPQFHVWVFIRKISNRLYGKHICTPIFIIVNVISCVSESEVILGSFFLLLSFVEVLKASRQKLLNICYLYF